ncbi:hypothetical protein SteCoe_6248 [Stentor coeruleus]|uniref:UDENN domain-containing protein n=1 Tax=Stentor coeruleus TaxID=5963 RepID=A0A1R2CQI6_9CILI|nr:hypothetical protein SteCoe_6248 [Stentor coeruleus]
MEEQDQDYQYWISRKIKISEEFNELRQIKFQKLEELNKEKRIYENNLKNIEELKLKIQELKDQLNGRIPSLIMSQTSKESLLNISTPIYSSYKNKPLQRLDTKEHTITLEETKSDDISDNIFEYFFILGSRHNSTEPQTIFCLPENNNFAEGPQGQVLGNFAFPVSGTKTRKIKEKQLLEELNKIHTSKLERDGKHFVFSVKSDIEKTPSKNRERANHKRDVLYCCCVFVDEFSEVLEEGYGIQNRCYCLLSYLPCFELLFKLLFSVIKMKNDAEHQLIKSTISDDYEFKKAFQIILRGDFYNKIKQYLEVYLGKKHSPSECPELDFKYSFPDNISEFDIMWYCPLLFSLITVNDFWYLLFAILQEASVIFLSQNLDYLSSCVLGFQGLIRPFSWPHLITPILPLSLLDILEAPVPLLAGIPKNSQLVSKKKLANLIFVDLDAKNIEKRLQKPLVATTELYVPKQKIEALVENYKAFSFGPCYHPRSEQVKACRKIFQSINIYIKGLFKTLPEIKNNPCEDLANVDDVIQVLSEQSVEESGFNNTFFNTQMCINYIEDFYFHKNSISSRKTLASEYSLS